MEVRELLNVVNNLILKRLLGNKDGSALIVSINSMRKSNIWLIMSQNLLSISQKEQSLFIGAIIQIHKLMKKYCF